MTHAGILTFTALRLSLAFLMPRARPAANDNTRGSPLSPAHEGR